MRNATEVEGLATLEKTAPRGGSARSNARVVPLWQPAPSDRSSATVSGNQEESWREGPTAEARAVEWPTSYELYMAARSHRAFVIGEFLGSAAKAIGSMVRGLRERYRLSREAAAAPGSAVATR